MYKDVLSLDYEYVLMQFGEQEFMTFLQYLDSVYEFNFSIKNKILAMQIISSILL
jgi:hypothetical protein